MEAVQTITPADVWETVQTVIVWLAGIGIVIDLTPGIKIQPVRWLIKQLGNLMNHDIKEQLNKIEKDLQEHKVESWRREILDFANSCMNRRRHTKEEFDNFFKNHDAYGKYIHENNLENGCVDMAFVYVKKIYLHCMETNDFLVEKDDKEDEEK